MAAPPVVGARNSTASRVRSMNASSSDACCGGELEQRDAGGSGEPADWSVLSPDTARAPSPGLGDRDRPGERSRAARAAGSVLRTRTSPRRGPGDELVQPVSAISRPRPMTIRCWAVSAISLIRCEETNTVRPSAASPWSSDRIHRMPSGSRPFTGSSRITVRRVAEQRGGDAEPLAHAEREAAGPPAGHLAQPDRVDHLVHPGAADPAVCGERQQVVVGAAAGVDRAGVQQGAHLAQRRGVLR